jgi:ubiquitin-like 1-activating enzyme E1 A
VDAAKSRIDSLNPLVAVEALTSQSVLEQAELERLVQSVDLVCITDSGRDFLVSVRHTLFVILKQSLSCTQIRVNEACRRSRKPLYAGGTYGLLGYIFCDLLEHIYIAPYVF